jgi:hypothetical protein
MNAPITIALNQPFTGTGSTSTPVSIADWINGSDWTLYLAFSGCFAGVALVSVEDSADGFVDDIVQVVSVDLTGPIYPGTFVGYSFRARELSSYRVGHLGASTRISVTSQSSSCTVTVSTAEIK